MSARIRVVLALLCALIAATLTVGLLTAALNEIVWTDNGVSVCGATGDQEEAQIIPDGSGGAILAWKDRRLGSNYDIYAQKVSHLGIAAWQPDGKNLCNAAGAQKVPQLVSDGAGGAIVVWEDSRDGTADIFAQRVSDNGNTLWLTDGITVCEANSWQRDPHLISDGSGGAILTWDDLRTATSYDIYAQRLDENGDALWATDGVSLCVDLGTQVRPRIATDGSGGAIVTWRDHRNGNADIYAQRVDSGGNALWQSDGVALCTAAEDQNYPEIVPDGYGGAIVTWHDERGSDREIYAQRVDSSGNTLWQATGVALCTASGNQDFPEIASDGLGGAIVTWQDERSTASDIYAQRVDASGNTLWPADGVSLCVASHSQYSPVIVADGFHGAIVAWQDYRSGGWSDIYAQWVSASGNTLWQTDGISLCLLSSGQYGQQIAAAGLGGAIVAWTDDRGSDHDIYAQKVELRSGLLEVRLPLVAKRE